MRGGGAAGVKDNEAFWQIRWSIFCGCYSKSWRESWGGGERGRRVQGESGEREDEADICVFMKEREWQKRNVCICVSEHIHVYVHVYIRMYTYTYIHIPCTYICKYMHESCKYITLFFEVQQSIPFVRVIFALPFLLCTVRSRWYRGIGFLKLFCKRAPTHTHTYTPIPVKK